MASLSSRPVRAGYCGSIAALLVVFGCESLQTATADGETRTISFHHTHISENLTVTYKVNGRYDEEALLKINHILRDWREQKPIKIDPHLIDVIWEVHREVEATEPIWIVCGYRSPDTNAMLRKRSSGVAKFSQHMLGKAMDFYIPGVPLEKLREAGLRAQRGGVGFYPSSNFVHMDTGSVRHWPRMPEAQLARVIAKGPLTKFASAKDRGTQVAAAKITNPFAKLFGGKDADEDEDNVRAAPAAPASKTAAAARTESQRVAAVEPKAEPNKAEKPAIVAAAVPMPVARPAAQAAAKPEATAKVEIKPAAGGFDLASTTSRPVQLRPAQSASLVGAQASIDTSNANDVISTRGFWQGLPEAEAPQASAAAKTSAPARRTAGTNVASAEPVATGSLTPWPVPARKPSENVLAYAPVKTVSPQSRPTPMGTARGPDTTVAVKRSGNGPTIVATPAAAAGPVKPGQRFNDPWMRAMIVSPSAGGFMSTSLLGAPDYRVLGPYLQKPTSSVMMTFSEDPHLGMTTAKFSGTAVVFVSTVTFYQRTAALQ